MVECLLNKIVGAVSALLQSCLIVSQLGAASIVLMPYQTIICLMSILYSDAAGRSPLPL